jgi:hypothetical protein
MRGGGKWDYCKSSWCDYMILQYGFGLSETAIKDMTRQAKNELGKPVVAGEYCNTTESESIRLGNAAVSAGASGFGNGGTPFVGSDKTPPAAPTGVTVK